MKLKRVLALALATVVSFGAVACSGTGETTKKESTSETKSEEKSKVEDVKLTVWVSKEQQSMIKKMCDEFAKANEKEVNLEVELGIQSEEEMRDAVLTDIKGAADVYTMANDQLISFVEKGALAEIPKDEYKDVIDRNTEISVETGTVDGKLYGFPRSADNGYFLYYNKKYLTEEDCASWRTLLTKAAKVGKKVSMQMNSGWYLWSFYRGAGFTTDVDENGTTVCTWNGKSDKYTGLQVTQAILSICKHKAFVNADSPAFEVGVKDGTLVAGVCGTWNAETVKKAWGENYAATKLPTYTLGKEQVQMYSVSGTKLMGVNAYSKNKDWALKLANFLTNKENQLTCFNEIGSGPSNTEALNSKEVQANEAMVAYNYQQRWAEVQFVGDNYWTPTETLGQTLAEGNKKNIDLQKLLDSTVKSVTTPVSK